MWFWLPVTFAQDDPWGLVRVDDPNHPDAIARSHLGAVLEGPPEPGTSWRIEEIGHVEQVGPTHSDEAIDAMDVQAWHDAGFTGAGVSVAVFDLQWFGAELDDAELGTYDTWDCWAHEGCTPEIDTLRPRFSYERGVHGTACAEIVREVAPHADLHLVRTNGVTAFENAAQWAIREEIDVVTLSMSYMNNSFYDGTGAVSEIVEEMTEGGVLLVTSAGNYADGHWSGPFTDTDGDGIMEFDDGSERLRVYFRSGKKRGIAMQWDNYRRCGDTDLDIVVYSADGTILDVGDEVQDPDADRCSPVERVAPSIDRDQWAEIEIHRVAGDPAVMVNLVTSSGKIERSMPAYSVTDPGTHPMAWTVGAVNATGYLDNGVEGFSSQGPNFAGDPKPDIVAPDGVSTASYGPTGFFGTSAASPAAAAALAVVMSADSSLDARGAADKVESWAVSDRSAWQGVDNERGAGHLRLPDPDGELPGCLGRGAWLAGVIVLPWARTRRTPR